MIHTKNTPCVTINKTTFNICHYIDTYTGITTLQ